MFLWGYWTQQKPTYFSAFLGPDCDAKTVNEDELYITPMAEEFCRYWSGQYPAQRGPILTKISVSGHRDQDDVIVRPGEQFEVTATATDPDSPISTLRYRWWVLDKEGKAVFGPTDTERPDAKLKAPSQLGTNYVVMVYVLAPDRRASGFTLPIQVKNGHAAVLPRSKLPTQIRRLGIDEPASAEVPTPATAPASKLKPRLPISTCL